MPRSEAYNLYLSVGSGFHNAQKGQTTLPRVAGRGEAACLEKKGYARRALSTRKTRYFSHNSFGTKRHTAKAWFLQELFPRSGSSREGEQERAGRLPQAARAASSRLCRRGNAGKKWLRLFCMENGGTSMEKNRRIKKPQRGGSQRASQDCAQAKKRRGLHPAFKKIGKTELTSLRQQRRLRSAASWLLRLLPCSRLPSGWRGSRRPFPWLPSGPGWSERARP